MARVDPGAAAVAEGVEEAASPPSASPAPRPAAPAPMPPAGLAVMGKLYRRRPPGRPGVPVAATRAPLLGSDATCTMQSPPSSNSARVWSPRDAPKSTWRKVRRSLRRP